MSAFNTQRKLQGTIGLPPHHPGIPPSHKPPSPILHQSPAHYRPPSSPGGATLDLFLFIASFLCGFNADASCSLVQGKNVQVVRDATGDSRGFDNFNITANVDGYV